MTAESLLKALCTKFLKIFNELLHHKFLKTKINQYFSSHFNSFNSHSRT